MDSPDANTTDVRVRHFWRNLITCAIVECNWGFALACVSMMTVVALYLRALGASPFIIGLVPGVSLAIYASVAVPGALVYRRLRTRKWPFIFALMPFGIMWLATAWVAEHVAPHDRHRALVLTLACMGVSSFITGFSGGAWTDFLNRVMHPARRGRAIGVLSACVASAMLFGGLYSAAVLQRDTSFHGFAVLFTVAGVLTAVSMLYYFPVVEAVQEPAGKVDLRAMVRLLLDRRAPWSRLIVARWAVELSRAPLIFCTVLTVSRFDLPVSFAGILTFLMAAGQVLISPVAGWLGDRRGHKATMVLSAVLTPAATLLVIVAPDPWLAYLGFLLLGAAPAGDFVGAVNLIIETAPEEDKTIYAALVETCMVPARLVGPVAAGAIAQWASPLAALICGAVLQLVAIAATLKLIVEPRHHEPHIAPPYYKPGSGT
jgi:MFS family permease